MTLGFHTSKRVVEVIAIIPTKCLQNQIAGFITHLMKFTPAWPVHDISIKDQEEEREQYDHYVMYQKLRTWSPPSSKNRFSPRNIEMTWNFQDMLALEREDYHKIFSQKSLGFREIWTKQGSKMTHLPSQNFIPRFIQYIIFFVLFERASQSPGHDVAPFLK